AEQWRLGMERFEIAADRDRLGNDRAVIELQGRHPLQRIDRGIGGRLVRQFAQIDLLGRHRDPLFRQEDLDPAGIGRPAPVIELHLSPFVNPWDFIASLSLPLMILREFSLFSGGWRWWRTVSVAEDRDIPMPSEKPLAKRRRLAAQRVREARERLTSTTGTRVAFDYELLRQFAENRLSASLVVLLLIGTVGFLSSLWVGAVLAGAWTAAVLVIHAVIITKCRQFLSEPSTTQDLKRWRLRFIILDLFYGLAWMYNLIHPVGQDEGSSTFMLFVMLLVVAVSSMLASSLPIAVFAATVPVTFAVALNFALQGDLHNYILGIMAIAAKGYFTLLAHRLYSAGLATLVARAEKDALIGELEQAKL